MEPTEDQAAEALRHAGFAVWHRMPDELQWSKDIHSFELDGEGRGWLTDNEGNRTPYDPEWLAPRGEA